jgi:glycosyltransferase involved in cell wall biosynthesis
MRVLLLTQILPYPPDAGPRVKTWHVLQHLAQRGHRITIVSFVRPEERAHLPAVMAHCDRVVAVPLRRSRLADGWHLLRSRLTGRPFLLIRDDLSRMRGAVEACLSAGDWDVVHADQLTMTQFVLSPKGAGLHPYRIFDAHNATWTILNRMARGSAPAVRAVLGWEAQRIRAYEGRVVRTFEHTLAVSEADRRDLLAAAADGGWVPEEDRISVVPIAVDTEGVTPVKRSPRGPDILTLGTLHYAPNAEGVRWFLQHVFPRILAEIPEARLTIVGRNPPRDFLRLARQRPDRLNVAGYVPDLTQHLQQAAVVVVPVLSGSGMRVRILEAMARGMPIVTTNVGREGIDARPGEDMLVEDSPEGFAAQVVNVLRDPALQARLAKGGRRLAEARYDRRVVLKELDRAYAPAERPRSPSGSAVRIAEAR